MIRFCLILLGLAAWTAAPAAGAAETAILHACETLDGVALVDSRNLPDARLEVNTDPGFISEGKGSLHLRATTRPDTNITYLSADIPIPATDFSEAMLELDAWSAAPESTRAFYVRGYDAAGRCALSWMTWNAPLATEATRVLLVPETRFGIMKWEPYELKGGDRTAVTRLRVYIGAKGSEKVMDLFLDRIAVRPLDAEALSGPNSLVPDRRRFTDHGVGAAAAELRSVAAFRGPDGRPYLLSTISDQGPRGSVLVTDIEAGQTHQVFCPRAIAQVDAFGAMVSSRGRFYYTQGPYLLELDPSTRTWLFTGRPVPNVSVYLCFTEGPDGTIWFGGVYETQLASYNPDTQELRDHGRLDPEEKYVSFLAVDRTGWLYGGIGTARCNIVGYNPATGERRSLLPEADRILGTAQVYPATDGTVYGAANSKRWRLLEGRIEPMGPDEKRPDLTDVKAIRYGSKLYDLPDGRRVKRYDLDAGQIEIAASAAAPAANLAFTYATEGANITSLGAGPDGIVYGSTSHPMHFLSYDSANGTTKDFGPIPSVGGGNFCAIAASDRLVFGAQYAAGQLWAFDPAKPWAVEGKPFSIGIAARDLADRGTVTPGHLTYLDGHDVVFIHGDNWTAEAAFPLEVTGDQTAPHYVYVQTFRHTNYSSAQIFLDDRPLGEPVVGRSENTGIAPVLEFGPYPLTPGRHTLRLRLIEGTGESPFFGIRSALLSRERVRTTGDDQEPNPRPIGRWQEDVCRPRTALVHPDGRHVMMAGYAGYGRVGGGIGIVDLETGTGTLLSADKDLLPGHSCVTLKALPGGDLVGGTAIDAPGGGHATAKEAEIFIVDWATRKVAFRTVPVPGASTIVSLMTHGPMVYGLANDATFFVFDSRTREVVHRESYSPYGSVPRHAFQMGPDNQLYVIMSDAMLRIDPTTYTHRLLTWNLVQASAGGAIAGGRLVFAHGSHVWSYALPDLEPAKP